MTKRQNAIIYLDTNKILFYIKESKLNFQLDITSEMLSDLEIVNKGKFTELIDLFFQKQSITGLEFDGILVFSQHITFEKSFSEDTIKAQYEEIQKFLSLVPFEDVLSNAYKINKKTKVIAINKALFDFIAETFKKNKVYISSAIPVAVLVEVDNEFTKGLNFAVLAAKSASLKQYSIIDLNANIELNKKNSIGIKKKDVRLYLLLGVFLLLFLVLIFMIYTTFFPAKSKLPKSLKSSVPSVKTAENNNFLASPSADISTSSAFLNSTTSAIKK